MRRLWVILVLLVALPLHGWAVAAMAAQPSAGWEEAAAAGELPCHGSPEPSGDPHDQADLGASSHTCEACQLCHAWQAVLTEGTPVPAAGASLAHPLVHPRDTGRLMTAGLERPPRR